MRAARVSIYLVAVLVVWLYAVVIGRVWCTWLAPKGSPERVRRANWLVRHWSVVMARLTLATFKAKLEIRGTVPIGRFLIVSNHQSIADIAIVSAALRHLNVKFVAKEELGRRIPGVSLALREWGQR